MYEKLKKYCDEKIKKYPHLQNKYKKEIEIAERYYKNGKNLVTLLKNNKEKISNRYVIPFLLGLTKKVTDEEFEYKLIEEGSSGGIDIDIDFSSEGKKQIKDYLVEKYGEDYVLPVGTNLTMGLANAVKDLLRVNGANFQKSNKFTSLLEKDKTWEENIENIKQNHTFMYDFYKENKDILDFVPVFLSKVRQRSKHAGGIVITEEKYSDLLPVNRVRGEIVTAFQESSQEQILDELGFIKYDLLAITILDILKTTVDLIDEELYLIEEDGIKKIVPKSYIKEELKCQEEKKLI